MRHSHSGTLLLVLKPSQNLIPCIRKCIKVSSNSILSPTCTLILSSHAGVDLPYLSADCENKHDPYYSKMHFIIPRVDTDMESVSHVVGGQIDRQTDGRTGPEKREKRNTHTHTCVTIDEQP